MKLRCSEVICDSEVSPDGEVVEGIPLGAGAPFPFSKGGHRIGKSEKVWKDEVYSNSSATQGEGLQFTNGF